ncbi:hypothetical protein FE257_004307, partial [Aspergillus nanangensis]
MAPVTRLQVKRRKQNPGKRTLPPQANQHRLTSPRMSKTDFLGEFERLLKSNASIEIFQEYLTRNSDKDYLRFLPPYDFDNIFDKSAVNHAVLHNRHNVIDLVLQKQNTYKFNVLHVAVVYDSLALIERLINDIPRYGHELDKNGKTLLHLAFHKVNAKSAKRLLESGCWEKYSYTLGRGPRYVPWTSLAVYWLAARLRGA